MIIENNIRAYFLAYNLCDVFVGMPKDGMSEKESRKVPKFF